MTTKRKLFVGVAIATFAIFLVPWKRTIVPAVRIRVLDELGNPAAGVLVQEKWEYRSVTGSYSYREKSRADEEGYAAFPSRTERVALFSIILSGAVEIIHLPHGYGYGSTWTIWAYGEDPHVWYYVPLSWYEKVPDEMRLKRWGEERTPEDTKWP